MRVASVLCAGAFAVVVGTYPAAANARLADFDLAKLDNWSDAIAVCDITRFLLTDPDVGADVILVSGHDNTRVVLYRPLFAPPNNFFSDAMRETFEKVRRAGFVTAVSYGRARLHYAGAMIDAYRHATLAEKQQLRRQMELCYELAARAGVKMDTKH